MKRPVYVLLLHAPMVDRNGKEVVTAVTNLDIHDIARSSRTFGIARYYIVNPEPEQERLVRVILEHWRAEVSKEHHPSRAQALEMVRFLRTFEETYNEISAENGGARPFVVMPDAKTLPNTWTYAELRQKLEASEAFDGDTERNPRPLVIAFGTGWGLSPKFYPNVDRVLSPIHGPYLEGKRYNHLSVRAAAAIVLDRLFGT